MPTEILVLVSSSAYQDYTPKTSCRGLHALGLLDPARSEARAGRDSTLH